MMVPGCITCSLLGTAKVLPGQVQLRQWLCIVHLVEVFFLGLLFQD